MTRTSYPTPDQGELGSVYILEFVHPADPTRKLGNHARWYIGFATNLSGRIHNHRKGRGARITQAAVEAGFELQVACVWHGVTRAFERQLKNQKNAKHIAARAYAGKPVYGRYAESSAEVY